MGDSWCVAREAQMDAYGAGEAGAALVEALHEPNCSEGAPVGVAGDVLLRGDRSLVRGGVDTVPG